MSHKTIDDRVFSGVMSKYLRKKGGGTLELFIYADKVPLGLVRGDGAVGGREGGSESLRASPAFMLSGRVGCVEQLATIFA